MTLRSKTLALDHGEPVARSAKPTTLEDLERMVETDYRNNRRTSFRELRRAFTRLKRYFGSNCAARTITSERIEADSVFRRYAIVDEGLLAENMKKLAALSARV